MQPVSRHSTASSTARDNKKLHHLYSKCCDKCVKKRPATSLLSRHVAQQQTLLYGMGRVRQTVCSAKISAQCAACIVLHGLIPGMLAC